MGNTPPTTEPLTWPGDTSRQYDKAAQQPNTKNERRSPYHKSENIPLANSSYVIPPPNCFTDTDSNVIIEKYKKKQYTDTEFYENLIKLEEYESPLNPVYYRYYRIYAIFNIGADRPYHFCAKFSNYTLQEVVDQIKSDRSNQISDDMKKLGEHITSMEPTKNLKDIIQELIDERIYLPLFLKKYNLNENHLPILQSLVESLQKQKEADSRQSDLLLSHVGKGEKLLQLDPSKYRPLFGKDKITVLVDHGQLNNNITLSVLKNICLSWWYQNDIIYGGDQFPSSCSGSVFCIVGETSQDFVDKVRTWKSKNSKLPLKEYLYNISEDIYKKNKNQFLSNFANQPRGHRHFFGRPKKSTRKSTRKSIRKSTRKVKKSTRKSARKSTRKVKKSTRKPKKSVRKSLRKI